MHGSGWRDLTTGARSTLVGGALFAVALVGCTADGGADAEPPVSTLADPAPGMFERVASVSGGIVGAAAFRSLFEMAETADLAFDGWLVDIDEGYEVDAEPGAAAGTEVRLLELIIDRATADPPIRLLWPYPAGYDLDTVREAFPIGSRMVVYADRFEVPADERARWHHVSVDGEDPDDDPSDPDAGHEHWRPVSVVGVFVEDPEGEHVDRYGDAVFTDAPAADASVESWLVVLVPFDDVSLRGTCADVTFDVASDEPTEFDNPEDAVADFAEHEDVLAGLQLSDGDIMLRGEQVGSYQVAERPEGTYAVVSAAWCHPERSP